MKKKFNSVIDLLSETSLKHYPRPDNTFTKF